MAEMKILFACVGNCCRSQMAEGFGKKIAGGNFDIYSAVSHPAGFVHPDVIAVMKEVGIDISSHYSKGFQDLPADKFDYVVTMGCGEDCPVVAARERIDWKIEDPIGKGKEAFCRVRDTVKSKVEEFLSSIDH